MRCLCPLNLSSYKTNHEITFAHLDTTPVAGAPEHGVGPSAPGPVGEYDGHVVEDDARVGPDREPQIPVLVPSQVQHILDIRVCS